MIRVKCPKCSQALALDDGKAGTVIACPGCKQKFRVPAPKAGTPAKAAPKPPAGPAAGAAAAPQPRRRWDDEDEDDYTPYSFTREQEESRGPAGEEEYQARMVREAEKKKRRERAWERLGPPAKLMKWIGMVAASLTLLVYFFGAIRLILDLYNLSRSEFDANAPVNSLTMDMKMEKLAISPRLQAALVVEFIANFIFTMTIWGLILAAAEQMKKLEGYGYAIVGSLLCIYYGIPMGIIGVVMILALLAGGGLIAFVLFGIPALAMSLMFPCGLWTLILLLQRDIRREFRLSDEHLE
jgi:DNA-directed RNA polymerase subunit RPC12/RpoP